MPGIGGWTKAGAVGCLMLVAVASMGVPARAADFNLRSWCGSSGEPVISGGSGTPVQVRLSSGFVFTLDEVNAQWWRTSIASNDVEALHFYSQSWLWRAADRALLAGDASTVDKVVDLASQSAREHPDPGGIGDFQWNEGANLWRLRSLVCLFSMTHDDRLRPAIDATVAVALDPMRYYGPPRFAPHNHGLFANGSLLLAAHVLDRPDLRALALLRMGQAAPGWITSAGLGVEQSSAYHQVNTALWARTMGLAAVDGPIDGNVSAAVTTSVERAENALGYLVAPDLRVASYGDAATGPAPLEPRPKGVLLDRQAGVLAGRWSWSSPDDFYLARFGPRRTAHGHFDHGQVLWWATGRPVTADPGTGTYVEGAARAWQMSQAAHSVSIPKGGVFDPRGVMVLSNLVSSGPSHAFTLTGTLWGQRQARRVVVDSLRNTLTVTDTAVRPLSQVWQLDPRWLPVAPGRGSHTSVFRDSTGGRLVISTNGTIAVVARGGAKVSDGWVFAQGQARTAAARVVVVGGRSIVTRLSVSGPPVKPWEAAERALPPASTRADQLISRISR